MRRKKKHPWWKRWREQISCPIYLTKYHKLWIKLNPSKLNFIKLLDESINQGYNSLKSIERWSRHGKLLKYVNMLESWDDKFWEDWEPPHENHLDCDTWLEGEELRINQSTKIHYYMDKAFKMSDKYISNFKPYLQMYYDNQHINYDIVMNEKLKILKRLYQSF